MLIFRWAFQALPDERWQIIGCLPYQRLTDGRWQGWNLTWYGFFNAVAVVFAVCMFLILTGSLSTPLIAGLSLLTLLLAICLPAAKMIAFLIEKKQNTFTVGGASFIGIIAAPWIISLTNVTAGKWLGFQHHAHKCSGRHVDCIHVGRRNRQTGLYQLRLLLRKTSGRLFTFDQ
jgi:hypothetical protein